MNATIMVLSILLSIVFIALGLLHFNWVVGGQFGFAESLPTKITGERVLNPKKTDSLIVGLALTVFGFFYILDAGVIGHNLPTRFIQYAGWIIPAIFILRAIGDFRYVGFFKSVKTTAFGKLDTKFMSPLCLAIGILGLIIQLAK